MQCTTFFDSEWTLVAGHVGVDVTGVYTVDNHIYPGGVVVEGPLLDLGQCTHPHLGHHVAAVRVAQLKVVACLCSPKPQRQNLVTPRQFLF